MKKTIFTVVCILSVFLFGVLIFNSFVNKYNIIKKESQSFDFKINPSDVGEDIKKVINQKDTVVAEINKDPIYYNDVQFRKYRNKIILSNIDNSKLNSDSLKKINEFNPVDEKDIIKYIAKRRLMISDAKKYGIVVTEKEMSEKMLEADINNSNKIEEGDADAIHNNLLNEQFFDSLGIKRDEYNRKIWYEIYREYMVYSRFVVYFYENIYKGNQEANIDYFDQYLEKLFCESNFKILKPLNYK
ncbi:MAG: hypothetical protein BGN88_14800 [Clostridiales bacterium 43-6]|nr:MAG: hypothetical protein BGN88_14800 [Clostridiales bacterium 43-6]